jgi:hypothetical protein
MFLKLHRWRMFQNLIEYNSYVTVTDNHIDLWSYDLIEYIAKRNRTST